MKSSYLGYGYKNILKNNFFWPFLSFGFKPFQIKQLVYNFTI